MDSVTQEDLLKIYAIIYKVTAPGIASDPSTKEKVNCEQLHTEAQASLALDLHSSFVEELNHAFDAYVAVALLERHISRYWIRNAVPKSEKLQSRAKDIPQISTSVQGSSDQNVESACLVRAPPGLFAVNDTAMLPAHPERETLKCAVGEDVDRSAPPGLSRAEQTSRPPSKHEWSDGWASSNRSPDSRSSRCSTPAWRHKRGVWHAVHQRSPLRSNQQPWQSWG